VHHWILAGRFYCLNQKKLKKMQINQSNATLPVKREAVNYFSLAVSTENN